MAVETKKKKMKVIGLVLNNRCYQRHPFPLTESCLDVEDQQALMLRVIS